MKKYIFILLLTPLLWGCNDEEFLSREPKNVLSTDLLFNDKELVKSVLADLYDRQIDFQRVDRWWEYANFDYAFASANGDYWRHKQLDYPYDWWRNWDYTYVRHINLYIERIKNATGLSEEDYIRYNAEGRFLRAVCYFELVKRMGGVPLILESLTYDYSGDASYLQYARSTEKEVYDWVLAELDSIKNDLPSKIDIKSAATKGAAIALKSRVALYAASIAKYGATTPEVSLPGGEVGIPLSNANIYYQIALDAVEELESLKLYSLFNQESDPSENFAKLFLTKNNNSELIWIKDFSLEYRYHGFTLDNSPLTSSEEGTTGGRLNPSLNFVQSFELLDNSFAPYRTNDEVTGDFIYYDNPGDIFANRDPRLAGTVLLPGMSFKGKPVDIMAGYLTPDENGDYIDVVTAAKPGALAKIGDTTLKVVGNDGPIDGYEFTAQTGFYARKFLDPTIGSARIGTQSDVAWPRLRFAEVLLNGAEAAFELGQTDVALGYINRVRERAGFEIPLEADDLTFDRIVHERNVELAFEDHHLWDMKRWRLAHIVWDGMDNELTTNPLPAAQSSTRPFGLIPYRIYDPGSPNHLKWVFKKVLPTSVTQPHRFRLGNYYSQIADDVISHNPKLVRNPNQ
ncbi:MAG: RagB/SusD family nutrient uptake outer membrane protein [Bacteroidales bacterium]|nr:RagB/SusD family nutrient uptake outer membrane protein [Bacteroidales bacterium]